MKKKSVKQVQLDFYKRMLVAKAQKKAKMNKEKELKQEEFKEPPKQKGDNLHSLPEKKMGRIEVTEQVSTSHMDEHTSTASALEKALQRIEQQAKGL